MPPEIIEAIAPLIALVGVGTFTLLGLRMYFGFKARRLEIEAGRTTGSADESIETLRDEVYRLRTDVGDLQERVDFAERLLTRGKED
ncbi:MAG: hypothetical protein OEY20_02120 [Gemmatimonadota bacterium]|nr:hypothetical protein [Gemmatimonadota bacterium]